MSGIPSDIAGSSLQAGFQARNVAGARDAERAAQSATAKEANKAVDQAGETVETDDRDSQVYADAEGTGSQGRAHEEELVEEGTSDGARETDEELPGDEDRPHLDIEA